jgi:hypothetical protein
MRCAEQLHVHHAFVCAEQTQEHRTHQHMQAQMVSDCVATDQLHVHDAFVCAAQSQEHFLFHIAYSTTCKHNMQAQHASTTDGLLRGA